jgi:hypothetical protein
MNGFERILAFGAVLLAGCGTVKDIAMTPYDVTHHVAVHTYQVVTTPIRHLRRHGDESTTATTSETVESDVTQPGEPVPAPEMAVAPQRQRSIETESSEIPRRPAPRVARETTQANPKRWSSRASETQTEFPTAKAVPGKPGYVFSPFDASGRYVDVSGYASGSKVKDPWTDKIFVVP